jgi:hypothetical protein
MYDNGQGPLVNAGYVGLTGLGAAGAAAGFLHQALLAVTVLFTAFVLYRLVARGVRTSRR